MAVEILIAHEQSNMARVIKALAGYTLTCVSTIEDALNTLQKQEFDAIVIGLHFDESRALELVKHLRQDSRFTSTPVFVIRVLQTPYASILKSALDIMIMVKAVDQYLECDDQSDKLGSLRKAIDSILPPEKVAPVKRPRSKTAVSRS